MSANRSGFQHSDFQDPDPAENGPDPQPCSWATLLSQLSNQKKTELPHTTYRNEYIYFSSWNSDLFLVQFTAVNVFISE